MSPIQHWDYVEANKIPYLEAQIIKYVTRHEKKDGIKDLRKAQHFLEKLIEVRYQVVRQPITEQTLRIRCDHCGAYLDGSNMCTHCGHIHGIKDHVVKP